MQYNCFYDMSCRFHLKFGILGIFFRYCISELYFSFLSHTCEMAAIARRRGKPTTVAGLEDAKRNCFRFHEVTNS